MEDHRVRLEGWEECKVMPGARTISVSPSGNFLFAACNSGSRLCVVDTRTMKLIASAQADSYPVGLDISADGSVVILTSQGRKGVGGNSVDIFQVEYKAPEISSDTLQDEQKGHNDTLPSPVKPDSGGSMNLWLWCTVAAVTLALAIAIITLISRKRRKSSSFAA